MTKSKSNAMKRFGGKDRRRNKSVDIEELEMTGATRGGGAYLSQS